MFTIGYQKKSVSSNFIAFTLELCIKWQSLTNILNKRERNRQKINKERIQKKRRKKKSIKLRTLKRGITKSWK